MFLGNPTGADLATETGFFHGKSVSAPTPYVEMTSRALGASISRDAGDDGVGK